MGIEYAVMHIGNPGFGAKSGEKLAEQVEEKLNNAIKKGWKVKCATNNMIVLVRKVRYE